MTVTAATPILQSPAGEMHAALSPNGQFIAFTSDEFGRDEVFIQSFPDATTRRKVSSGGGQCPRWSRKGEELYFRSLDGQLIAVRSAQGDVRGPWKSATRDATDRTTRRGLISLPPRLGRTNSRIGSGAWGSRQHLAQCARGLAGGIATIDIDYYGM